MSGIALLYARVSTQMQVNDGASLDIQERQLRTAAELAGFTEMELVREEGRSGKSITGRPALRAALERLDGGDAQALFVTRIDRLARSTQDFLSIVDRANKNDWRLVTLDLNLDTSTYQGRFVVTIMSALAEMERGIIADRQKSVHSDRRARGVVWGVDTGPLRRVPDDIVERILGDRKKGISFGGIAAMLNNEGIATGYDRGKKWYASTVKKIYDSEKKKLGPDESEPNS